jgi:putative viral A-type inclusion protein
MKDPVEVSKEEILFSKGNPDVIKAIVIGKVIERKIKETDFEKKEEANIKIIESNAYINYYLDLQVRKNVVVTQQEVSDIYEAERGKLGNITPNDAYNQIANGLLNNKANGERLNVINKIAEEYKIEDLVKENLK